MLTHFLQVGALSNQLIIFLHSTLGIMADEVMIDVLYQDLGLQSLEMKPFPSQT